MTEQQQQPMIHATVVEFVENHLSRIYRRQVTDLSDTVWCPEWWRHGEAVMRLEALWRAWEHYRLDARTGMSVWFLEHADPHMSKLFDPRGPFKYCSVRNGHKDMISPLPTKSPQHGMFDDPTVGHFRTESA
ncbi:DUF4913 domain-containing protein [Nocardia sp. CNY236]|uniref:DUF4913 domain-containing protein n=1 Tax=Nocardia sp. CNY236 TaxID=1169152 RepID=UPI000410B1B2|nr:DUF4913 domain-containing protein [Nocardia sp. CNY236]